MLQQIRQLADSARFQRLTVYIIIACSVIIGVETIFKSESAQLFFHYIDFLFVAFFVFEIVVRMLACEGVITFFTLCSIKRVNGKRGLYFHENAFWNWFDLTLVAFSLVSVAAHLFEHPDFIEVARLFRIFRIMRLLEVSDNLKQVEKRIISIVPTIFSFGLLLIILVYIYATLGVYLFGNHTFEKSNFTTLYDALLTMFQMMTLDGWSEVMNEVKKGCDYPAIVPQVFFVSFVVFTAIVTFNVFIAVMTSQVQEKTQKDLEVKQQEISAQVQESDSELQQLLLALSEEVKALRAEVKDLKRGEGR